MSRRKLHTHRQAIMAALDSAITSALHNPLLSEPQLVANLACEIPKIFNAQVYPLASTLGFDVSVGAVFVHQNPKVTVANFPLPRPGSVEIGDVLFLVKFTRANGAVERHSLLLQAKKAKSIPVTPDNPNQYYVYANWPPITYTRAGPNLKGKTRTVTGPYLYAGAKYLLLKHQQANQWPQICQWYAPANLGSSIPVSAQPALLTQPSLTGYDYFICELYDLIFGNAGRTFIYQPPSQQNWDQVMTDLIDETVNFVTTYTDSARGAKAPRGQGVLCFCTGMTNGDLSAVVENRSSDVVYLSLDDGPPEVPPRDADFHYDLECSGISIIEFNITELEPGESD